MRDLRLCDAPDPRRAAGRVNARRAARDLFLAPSQRNSARMLCRIHEICGVWDCDIADFSCPRHEWEHGDSYVEGMKVKNECGGAGRGASPPHVWGAVLIAVLAVVLPAVGVDARAR